MCVGDGERHGHFIRDGVKQRDAIRERQSFWNAKPHAVAVSDRHLEWLRYLVSIKHSVTITFSDSYLIAIIHHLAHPNR